MHRESSWLLSAWAIVRSVLEGSESDRRAGRAGSSAAAGSGGPARGGGRGCTSPGGSGAGCGACTGAGAQAASSSSSRASLLEVVLEGHGWPSTSEIPSTKIRSVVLISRNPPKLPELPALDSARIQVVDNLWVRDSRCHCELSRGAKCNLWLPHGNNGLQRIYYPSIVSSTCYIVSVMSSFVSTDQLTIAVMPSASPTPGEILVELRTRKGLSGRQVAKRSGLSHTYISDLEKRPGKLEGISLATVEKLARAYGVTTMDMIAIARGLHDTPYNAGQDTAFTRQTVPPSHIETYPIYGSAAATFDADSDSEPEELVAINGEDRRRWGVRRKNVRAIRVNGDCLVSEGAQRGEFSINHGDTIFIDIDAPIQDGDLGVWWDHRTDTLIAKFAREESEGGKDAVVLYDARGRIQIREKDNPDLTPVGVVWARQGVIKRRG